MVNGLTIRAVHVSHIVPTTGFIVEDKKARIAFSSDTGPTHRFWEIVEQREAPEGRDHGDARSPTSCRTSPTSPAT